MTKRNNKKYTYDYVKSFVEQKDGILLSKQYNGSNAKLEVLCKKCNYVFKITFSKMHNANHWCHKCGGSCRFSYDEVKDIVNNGHRELVSKSYKNINTKLDVLCYKCNKLWHPTFSAIQVGSGCYNCSKVRKHTYDEVKLFIESKNAILISKEYENSKTKLDIKCLKCSNFFKITFDDVKNGNYWCAYCAGNKKLTHQYVENFVKNKGGELLSPYIRSVDKIKIKCNCCNNIWSALWDNIKGDHWCPRCNKKPSKSQKLLFCIMSDIFTGYEVIFDYKGFDWLKNPNTGARLEIDIWIPHLKLAIEYDGEQHFKPVRFGGISTKRANIKLKEIQVRDEIKNILINKHQEDIRYFIRIPYTEKLDKGNILNILMENKIIF